jgi:dienelactone hydrolase
MHEQTLEYSVEGTRYIGFFAVDTAREGRRPGVLIAPEGGGLNDVSRDRARELARLGYAAFAIDYHGEGRVLPSMQAMQERLAVLRGDPMIIRGITRTAHATLSDRADVAPSRIAAIGYCYGGTAVLELARSGADVACTVGFHSGLATKRPDDAHQIKGKVLVCIGADDPLIQPPERLAFEDEMRKARVDWRLYLFGNAVHGFANPEAGRLGIAALAYHRETHERSWRAMLDLFAECFDARTVASARSS